MIHTHHRPLIGGISLLIMLALLGAGCKSGAVEEPNVSLHAEITPEKVPTAPKPSNPQQNTDEKTSALYRDNTPNVRIPTADGLVTYSNPSETAIIDASHTNEGYVMVSYTGENAKVKLQITGSNGITYSYDLHHNEYEAFPLTSESGSYTIAIYESLPSSRYSVALSKTLDITVKDSFSPYLYPNQYVEFDSSTKAVLLASELVSDATTDLDAVTDIYHYVINHITYDHDKARNVQSGYLPVVDDTLASGKGICFDYAAVMAAMLRSQNIPTRLEIGYADNNYHAWISTYITDIGWINGIIEFDGKSWTLMDPTFAANSSEKTLKKFIGNGSHYQTEFVY